MAGERRREKEDVFLGTGATPISRISPAYTRNRRMTTIKAVTVTVKMTMTMTMMTTTVIGTTWRRRNRRRMITMT